MRSAPRNCTHFALLKTAVVVVAALASIPAWSQVRSAPSELLQRARHSPQYQGTIPVDQLEARGLSRIKMDDSIYLDLDKYVKQSRLTAQPDLQALFRSPILQMFLKSKPVYEETILKLQDRIVVERKLDVALKAGTCASRELPNAIRRFCFEQKAGSVPASVAENLDEIRARLASAPPSRTFKAGVTAGEAARMDDTALLALLINSDARTIRHTSVIPLQAYPSILRNTNVDMVQFSERLPDGNRDSPAHGPGGSQAREMIPRAPRNELIYDNTPDLRTKNRYFLTGFTIGRRIHDDIEYTFADETLLTDRYYINLSYELSFGFGLRMPFSYATTITPVSGKRDDRRTVAVSVAPTNVDRQGLPAYPAVGLDENQYFDGDEFVLELIAYAGLYLSIPGEDIELRTRKLNIDKSTSIDPVIGNDRTHIGDVVLLPASITGLQFNTGVVGAGIDLGLNADLADGQIGMRMSAWDNTDIIGSNDDRYVFHDSTEQRFTLKPVNARRDFGFVIDKPVYSAQVEIAPFIQPWANVDLGVWEKQWTMDPLVIDALSISLGFSLGAHAGTKDRYVEVLTPSPHPIYSPNPPIHAQPTTATQK